MNAQLIEENIGLPKLLGRKEALLSIDEYAAKREISIESVEQSVKTGAIQFRRHKGKTFIIDQPLKNHSHRPAPIVVPFLQQIPQGFMQNKVMTKQDIPAGSISRLALKMYKNSHQSEFATKS